MGLVKAVQDYANTRERLYYIWYAGGDEERLAGADVCAGLVHTWELVTREARSVRCDPLP